MDSKERDQRAKKGFGDRGDKLFNPDKKKKTLQKKDHLKSSETENSAKKRSS